MKIKIMTNIMIGYPLILLFCSAVIYLMTRKSVITFWAKKNWLNTLLSLLSERKLVL